MAMVDVDGTSLQVGLQSKSVDLVWELTLSLHSSNELGEFSQWPCRDNSITNIVISISISIKKSTIL